VKKLKSFKVKNPGSLLALARRYSVNRRTYIPQSEEFFYFGQLETQIIGGLPFKNVSLL
jgi:hypothetical protein